MTNEMDSNKYFVNLVSDSTLFHTSTAKDAEINSAGQNYRRRNNTPFPPIKKTPDFSGVFNYIKTKL